MAVPAALQTQVPDYDQGRGVGWGQLRGAGSVQEDGLPDDQWPSCGVNQEREQREGVGVKRGWERKGPVLLKCHMVCFP